MEKDRFGKNQRLYIIGLVSLILAVGLFLFSIYIIPFLVFDMQYDVPLFVNSMIFYFRDNYSYNLASSKFITWLIFFVPCVVTGIISYFVSNHIDDELLEIKSDEVDENETETKAKKRQPSGDTGLLVGKIIFFMVFIVGIILFLQMLINLTS